jgi:hypothetical protein
VLVLENPYFAPTDGDGNYKISNVPPGKYKLKAWHERLPADEKEIIGAGNRRAPRGFHPGHQKFAAILMAAQRCHLPPDCCLRSAPCLTLGQRLSAAGIRAASPPVLFPRGKPRQWPAVGAIGDKAYKLLFLPFMTHENHMGPALHQCIVSDAFAGISDAHHSRFP